MKISKRGEYALRALIDLGIASELGWPMLQISELASKERLPIKFLEHHMNVRTLLIAVFVLAASAATVGCCLLLSLIGFDENVFESASAEYESALGAPNTPFGLSKHAIRSTKSCS